MYAFRGFVRHKMEKLDKTSSDGKHHKQFGKRTDKMILEPGDDVRIYKQDNIKDKDQSYIY